MRGRENILVLLHFNQDKHARMKMTSGETAEIALLLPIYITVFSTWQLTVLSPLLPPLFLPRFHNPTDFHPNPRIDRLYRITDVPMSPRCVLSCHTKFLSLLFTFSFQFLLQARCGLAGWSNKLPGGWRSVCVYVVNGRDKCRSFLLITRVICESESGGWEGQRLTQP